MQTDYPFEDKTVLKHKPETKEQSAEDLIRQHDIKILELDTRLRSLENLVNAMHNQDKYCIWWDVDSE